MKKMLAIVLALMLVFSATAAFAADYEIVSKGFQHQYWQAVLAGAQAKATELGVEINFVGPANESAYDEQLSQLNSAINAAPKAIGLAALSTETCLDAIKTAQESGIPIIGFDSGVPGAPEGAIYANASTDNYYAGSVAATGMWDKIEARIEAADGAVRIGEVNQDATGESVTSRGRGFIDKIIELAAAKGWGVAVTGNEYYVNNVQGEVVAEADAKIIIEARVPAQTTVELCSNEAAVILNEADTIAVFGSNQVAAEGIIMADGNLFVCGSGDDNIIAVGFDAGATLKAAVADGT
ncbi:MAG: substrate-binding domain-containing protein, partial [Clostridia bacterium]|nr:substrate-binding domain-containing protein [Clostridia bacterium]